MSVSQIRNFVIIAHIDSGKSTLADRLLEATGTVEERLLRPQHLDQLALERERGITIKMAPVRMIYQPKVQNSPLKADSPLAEKIPPSPRLRRTGKNQNDSFDSTQGQPEQSRTADPLRRSVSEASNLKLKNNPAEGETKIVNSDLYILNLIDTPGHSDFSYEVSRALRAVEGAVLLVDATKGIQAQTLANFRAARASGLTILGAVNKVDLNAPDLEKTIELLAALLAVSPREILKISAKTGEGVSSLLQAICQKLPPPQTLVESSPQALIFDSFYDEHKGIVAFVRLFDGTISAHDELSFRSSGRRFVAKEVGYFAPQLRSTGKLFAGEIGYLATGLREASLVYIGDTLSSSRQSTESLGGFRKPASVVFVSLYPQGQTTFDELREGLERLHLNDAALTFEPETNEVLGRGFQIGCLGQLHFEITVSRLQREFQIDCSTSLPSVAYRIREAGKELIVKQPADFPDKSEAVWQPMINLEIIAPPQYLASLLNLRTKFALTIQETTNLGDNFVLKGRLPLAELMRGFDDDLKSVSAGYASYHYELLGEEPARVQKIEILINGNIVPVLTRIVPSLEKDREARRLVQRLKILLPPKQFKQALQARAQGRIIARETIAAQRKDVTGYLYGGDRTRKMKLWKKQARGKKKLKELGQVTVSPEVIRAILKQ